MSALLLERPPVAAPPDTDSPRIAQPVRTAEPLLELRRIRKVYGEGQAVVEALRGIDLSIQEGDFVAVMGTSGSGKSTCMNLLGCLDVPTSGEYLFRGIDVGKLDR